MKNREELEFYKALQEQKKLNSEFMTEIRKISNEDELKKFIEDKILPLAKDMGYDFSVEELLDFDKNITKEILDQDLENVSGGANLKNWVTGGLVAFTALGAGILGSTTITSATLTPKNVAESNTILKDTLNKGESTKSDVHSEEDLEEGKNEEKLEKTQKETELKKKEKQTKKEDQNATVDDKDKKSTKPNNEQTKKKNRSKLGTKERRTF